MDVTISPWLFSRSWPTQHYRTEAIVASLPVISHLTAFISVVSADTSREARRKFNGTHILGKGHSQAAFSLWNNMLEPVGGKRWSWHIDEPFRCPTEEYPYLFTSKNSAKALSNLQRTTNQVSPITGSNSGSDIKLRALDKNEKPSSKTSSKKTKFIAVIIVLISMVAIVIWIVNRRRKTRIFEPQTGRQHFAGVHNHQLADDDDVEVWSRPNTAPVDFDDNKTTKTHGTRIPFD
jgi:hypothetical protein